MCSRPYPYILVKKMLVLCQPLDCIDFFQNQKIKMCTLNCQKQTMGPAHYVEARQFFFPKTTLAVKGINHILEEKNCQKGDVGYFSEGAAENSSEVGNPIVLDIGPPRLCPTELRRSFSYTRYLYLYLK